MMHPSTITHNALFLGHQQYTTLGRVDKEKKMMEDLPPQWLESNTTHLIG